MAVEKFHFTTSEGVEIVTPYMVDAINRKTMKKIQKEAEELGGFHNLEDERLFEAAGLAKDLCNQLDELSMRDYTAWFTQWADTGEIGLGES